MTCARADYPDWSADRIIDAWVAEAAGRALAPDSVTSWAAAWAWYVGQAAQPERGAGDEEGVARSDRVRVLIPGQGPTIG